MTPQFPTLFKPFQFKNGSILRNKTVMAPMTTWSSNLDGTVSDEEIAYYRRRSNGVGMVITGCTHVTSNGVGFYNEFAAFDDKFTLSLKALADAIKSGGAKAVLQVFHAGNKAVPELVEGGVVSSSSAMATPGPFNGSDIAPRELTPSEINEIVIAFGQVTRRAIEAGFDGIELHGAHGFLIQNFLSPRFNLRTDQWGGSLEKRMAFALAVVSEVKKVAKALAPTDFIIGYRFSPEEAEIDGLKIEDTLALIDELQSLEVDYIHASLADVVNSKVVYSANNELTIERIVSHLKNRIPLIVAGRIDTPDVAEKALNMGATLAAIGKGLVINPNWVELVQQDNLQEMDFSIAKHDIEQKSIPMGLWKIIESTTGWFPVNTATNLNR